MSNLNKSQPNLINIISVTDLYQTYGSHFCRKSPYDLPCLRYHLRHGHMRSPNVGNRDIELPLPNHFPSGGNSKQEWTMATELCTARPS